MEINLLSKDEGCKIMGGKHKLHHCLISGRKKEGEAEEGKF